MKGLRGKVVVVHFWTHGCFNCVNNYPHYRAWQDRYAGEKDLVILGIHTPETAGERAVDRIKQQAEKNGLKFAIAVDNDATNWQAWNNRTWPTVYVVDRRGVARYGWEGELNYKGPRGKRPSAGRSTPSCSSVPEASNHNGVSSMIRNRLLATSVVVSGSSWPLRRLVAAASEARIGLGRREARAGGRRPGAEVHPQGPGGEGAEPRRVPQAGEGRAGLLPVGRLVPVLQEATDPVAGRHRAVRGGGNPARRDQLRCAGQAEEPSRTRPRSPSRSCPTRAARRSRRTTSGTQPRRGRPTASPTPGPSSSTLPA